MKDSMWWFREQQGRKRKCYPRCSSPIPNINDSMIAQNGSCDEISYKYILEIPCDVEILNSE